MALIRARERNAGPAGLEALPPLYAVIAVEPADDSDDAFTARADIATQRLRRLGVRAICYRKDAGHTQLRSVILQLRHEAERRPLGALFLDRAREVDRLGALEAPTPADVDRVRDLIRGIPELARHFFEHSATSPAWFDALKDSVIVPGVIEPWRFGDGGERIAAWSAAPYVERLAATRPEAIVELIHRLSGTQNWHAHRALTEAATALPLDTFEEVLPIIGTWTASPHRRMSQIHIPLVLAARQLSERGIAHETVLAILGYLLTPIETTGEEGLEFRIVDHWLPLLEEPRDRLARDLPTPTYRVLRDRLVSAITAAQPGLGTYSTVWRPAIEDHEQNHPHLDWQIQILLDGTRDALVAWVDQDRDAAAREVDQLLGSEHAVLRRLALHAAIVHPEIIPLLTQPLLSEELLRDDEHFHEISLLLTDRFADLDDVSKDNVHRLIRDGTPAHVPEPEEQRRRRLDLLRCRWLAVLPPEHQSADERGWWEDALRAFGPRPHRHFLSGTTPAVHDHGGGELAVAAPDPAEAAWHDGGALTLLEVLRGRVGGLPALGRLVREDPEGFLDLAPLLEPEDAAVIEEYVGAYITLLEADAGSQFRWEPLIQLLGRVVSADPQAEGELSFKIGHLVGSGAESRVNPIPAYLLDASLALVASVIESSATPLDGEPVTGGWHGRLHQLNHAAGIAADAFMVAVWRQMRFARDDERKLQDEARGWIGRALSDGWGGQEVRHTLGQYGAILDWGEPGWLAAHFDGVWPAGDDEAAVNARRMFLHGFLHADGWSLGALGVLRPIFDEAISDLAREHPLYFDEPRQREALLRSLAAGWLNDIQGFDALLEAFLRVATDAERASLVHELGRQFRFDPVSKDVDYRGTLAKRDAYWRRRVEELRTRLPVAERSEELGAFCAWSEIHPQSLRTLEPRLAESIDHLASGFHTADLLDYLAARGEQEPLPALRLLNRLAERLFTDRDLRLWADSRELEAALGAVCRGAKPQHRRLVRQLADQLIRAGLNDCARRIEHCGRRVPVRKSTTKS